MAYSELIKNFNKIRDYMREFYVYGFRGREEFSASARTYDNERRRIEGWLGEYMRFRYGADGKAVFLSFDCKELIENPFFKVFRAKSFTDGDITLHFALFEILHAPEEAYTARELCERISRLLSETVGAYDLDESTLRKKLKEYCDLGLVTARKEGNKLLYSRACDTVLPSAELLAFFAEVAPCGVLGHYLGGKSEDIVRYRHHYVEAALESEILLDLLTAIREKRSALIHLYRKRESRVHVVPLAILWSTQNGRRYLAAYAQGASGGKIMTYRLDRIRSVNLGEVSPLFDGLHDLFEETRRHVWGVNFFYGRRSPSTVRFIVRIGRDEEYIFRRLEREKRCGTVTRIDEQTAEFRAELYDVSEIIPFVRSFLGRIVSLHFSDRTTENRLKRDFLETCRMYGLEDV